MYFKYEIWTRELDCDFDAFDGDTVDGRNPANQLRLVVYPSIDRVFYIPGSAGFQPSTLVCYIVIPLAR